MVGCVAFVGRGQTLDAGGYVVEQFVAVESDRFSTARRTLSRSLTWVMRRSGNAPNLANPHQCILLTCGGRGGLAHFPGLRYPKGPLPPGAEFLLISTLMEPRIGTLIEPAKVRDFRSDDLA